MTEGTPPTQPDARKAPRWMTVALFVSLAVNLLIVGIVAGAMTGRGAGGGAMGRRSTRGAAGSGRNSYVASTRAREGGPPPGASAPGRVHSRRGTTTPARARRRR